MEEDDTLELSIDPFAEVPLEETLQAAQKRSPKAPPLERLQAQERLQAAQKRSCQPPPKDRVQAAQKRSPQVGEEDILASKKEGRNVQHCKKNLNNLVNPRHRQHRKDHPRHCR